MLLGLTIFLSAFLLFQVQLIVAKHLLPWFGGSPTVWTTCQLFFQTSLLAGYAYAYWLGRQDLRIQRKIHLLFLMTAGAALMVTTLWSGMPLLGPETLRPRADQNPSVLILIILASTVGLPAFVLSSTGPLVQRWHSHTTHSLDQTYRLYALSNAGSLLGLLSYPFGVEWALNLPQQAVTWTALFLIFAGSCAAILYFMDKGGHIRESEPDGAVMDGTSQERAAVPESVRPWLWLLLSFLSSAMFLSTTNELSLDVASLPFLWVLPLGLYLSTFILCFERPFWYSRRWFTVGCGALSAAILTQSALRIALPISWSVLAYCTLTALFCMVCHGELARLRPGSSQLTRFYLWIAVGGALGGMFVGLLAPSFFTDAWEFDMTLLVGWTVFGFVGLADKRSPFHTGDRWYFALVAVIVCIVATYFLIAWTPLRQASIVARFDWKVPLVAGSVIASLVSLVLWRSKLISDSVWPKALAVLMILISSKGLFEQIQRSQDNVNFAARDFYGLIRVTGSKPRWDGRGVKSLVDGNTIHGEQLLGRESNTATAYYSRSSGIAAAIGHLKSKNDLHFGILGMGVGTMAAFARPGDRLRFYELNPKVIEISGGSDPHFTFIRDSAGKVTIVEGDGRLSLERELLESPQQFDLLAMDAFSSDAVPLHLLTEEAFVLYGAHLRNEDSILAVNISNRHLDLEPVLAAVARRLGFHGIRIDAEGDPPTKQASTWVLLARNGRIFSDHTFKTAKAKPLGQREVAFTDRYSNLFRVLK
jgi:spermidine synthase